MGRSYLTEHQNELFEMYRQMMIGRVGQVMHGWDRINLLDDQEITMFIMGLLASGDNEAICRFEKEVFILGNDAKTYMRRHRIVVSNATIDLSDDIMNKPTLLMCEPNCGGVDGHDGCAASTSTGLRDGRGYDMDHPAVALEFFHRKQAEHDRLMVSKTGKCCQRRK